MGKRITTIIAHYNYLDYLRDAVKSAEEQSYPNFICVIDDASDHTIDEIIAKVFKKGEVSYIEKAPTINATIVGGNNKALIYLNHNVGPAEARNIGIRATWNHTDAYQILDSDDYMLPDKISLMLKEMEKDWDNTGVIYADYYIKDLDSGVMKKEFKKPYDKFLLEMECIVHSGSLINKKALEDCGLYNKDLRVCEDFDLWKRISDKYLIKHIPEFLTVVLNHSNNSTNSVPADVWNDCYQKVVSRER